MIHEDLTLTIEALENTIGQYQGCADKEPDARRMRLIVMSMKRQLDAPFLTISQLSNEKGSRRIVARDFALKQRVLEIRESMNATPEESSVLCIRDEVGHDLGDGRGPQMLPYFPIRLDAETLFGLARQMLAWFGYEPRRSADHPDGSADAREIAEWIRVQAKAARDAAGEIMDGHEMGGEAADSPSYQDELSALAHEARAEDYESLATRMEAGEWRAKP